MSASSTANPVQKFANISPGLSPEGLSLPLRPRVSCSVRFKFCQVPGIGDCYDALSLERFERAWAQLLQFNIAYTTRGVPVDGFNNDH